MNKLNKWRYDLFKKVIKLAKNLKELDDIEFYLYRNMCTVVSLYDKVIEEDIEEYFLKEIPRLIECRYFEIEDDCNILQASDYL